ncbi:hypothetical protein ABE82_26380 (plasmid) [Paenibacillus peoriae]|uniref:hypothetical protein n=1 Tax=Paenibacillus peoriae TaxID=59893 RepID=UPI000721578B|nr:hypothetical protein [Paenibacillus peoriae]ALS09945.1 hypothetical protein ABE82_26380 [Paenibacillus peoriae]
MVPVHYRRSKVEKFVELLISKRDFYGNKADYYKSIPGNSAVDTTRLWEENRMKSDIYDEILKELILHFELNPKNHTERPKTSEDKNTKH